MTGEVLRMTKLTRGEKADKQKAKGLTLEEIWFWKMECESKKERERQNWEGREGKALGMLK